MMCNIITVSRAASCKPSNLTGWMNEAYAEAIAATDTGILRRNLQHLLRSLPLLNVLVDKQSRLLDVGGGYGILTRMLRDTGYDCYSCD